VLAEDRARCTAAAEGELLEAAGLEPRLGLGSALLLRERKPALVWVLPEDAALRC
jgi:hypothetical protein